MKLCHTRAATSAVFDDPNLVSAAGLVPVLALADSAGLARLAGEHLSVPGDKGANAGLKVASLVGGMLAGADSKASPAPSVISFFTDFGVTEPSACSSSVRSMFFHAP